MAKRVGFSAMFVFPSYIIANADEMYITSDSGLPATAGNIIVSALVSGADFTIASANQGVLLTIGAKNSQAIEGSGTATHLVVQTISGARVLYQTTVSSQVLASGNTVNIATHTITANISANNA